MISIVDPYSGDLALILGLCFGIPFIAFLLLIVFFYCGFRFDQALNGIVHCCTRRRARKEQKRQNKHMQKLQRQQARQDIRMEREVQRRVNEQLQRQQRTAQPQPQSSQQSMLQAPPPAHIALSAIPSDRRFNNGSQLPTLGRSAGLGGSNSSDRYNQYMSSANTGRVHEWVPPAGVGLPSDNANQASSSKYTTRSRLHKKPRPNHSLSGWSTPGPSQGISTTDTRHSSRLHKKSASSLSKASTHSRQGLL